MAGIGITLRELFKKETFFNRIHAYSYSALISAGPWISSIVVVNIMILIAQQFIVVPYERFVFMSSIVYSFVFSQIITAPWQFLITRYLADKLFKNDYDFIKPSFTGLVKIILTIAIISVVIFYYSSPLPPYYSYMAGLLFILLSIMWILMVYLSAVKGYKTIAHAFVAGGLISVVFTLVFLNNPIAFPALTGASNMLLAYLIGIIVTFLMLLYSFFQSFPSGNCLEYDFLRYFNKFSVLFFMGLFYTLGVWIDTIIIWFGDMGDVLFDTYRYSAIYDHAKFLAFLTTIPAVVLFVVYVETEFYEKFRNYYHTVRGGSSFDTIVDSKKKMVSVLYSHIVYLIERQLAISITTIILARYIFVYLGFSMLLRDAFRILVLGALSNSILLVFLLVLLYFELKKEAFISSLVFFLLNVIFTIFFEHIGDNFLGFGLFAAAFCSMILALYFLIKCLKNLEYRTFSSQPYFLIRESGFFIRLADKLNFWCERYALAQPSKIDSSISGIDMHRKRNRKRYRKRQRSKPVS